MDQQQWVSSMPSPYTRRPDMLRPIPVAIGAASLAVLPLHASTLGPLPDTAVALAIVIASVAAAVEWVVGDVRAGALMAALTLTFYFLFAFPLALVPEKPGLFHVIYIAVATLALLLLPVLLLRRRYLVAVASVFGAALLLAYTIP